MAYGMYVWREGWDSTVPGCTEDKFLDWDKNKDPDCFTHSWNTPEKRKWLWDTCNGEKEIKQLYLYDIHTHLSSNDCNHEDVRYLRETVREGRTQVSGLKIHALFSDGGDDVPEANRIPKIVWYNENCIQAPEEKIDGVAINNENWNRFWSEQEMKNYLDALYRIKEEAEKQDPEVGKLLTHFSLGWIWGKGENDEDIQVTWRGSRKYVMHHFIDVFDSVDTQVAFIVGDVMHDRLLIAGYDYAREQGKEMAATVYINHATPCQVTFSPFPESDSSCVSWSRSYKNEMAMFEQIAHLRSHLPDVRVVLHYFRGAYSSGGYPGWPRH